MSFSKCTSSNTQWVSNESTKQEEGIFAADGCENERTGDQVCTPLSRGSMLMGRAEREWRNDEMIEMESTPAVNSQSTCVNYEDRDQKFDSIARHVDKTIKELYVIYNDIGFSHTEIENKREKIYTVIEETILNFTANLSREKANIENECDWLRQQIIIILAMLNDHNGERILSLPNRGIVHNDMSMYEEGYRDEIKQKLHTLKSRKENFYEDSPFNVSTKSIGDEEDLLQTQYEEVLRNIPKLSLVQLRAKLNMIFLETLQMFVTSFKEFNLLAARYYEMISMTGNERISSSQSSILNSLPDDEEIADHRDVIDKFETMLEWLNIPKKRYSRIASVEASKLNDKELFIISSPRKKRIDIANSSNSFNGDFAVGDGESVLAQLREVNYRLIRIIRSLKITKITPDTISMLQNELNFVEEELQNRINETIANVDKCFEIIEQLELSEDQMVDIQNQYSLIAYDESQEKKHITRSALKAVRTNPQYFGLKSQDLKRLQIFTNVLEKMKYSKENKIKFYINSCYTLWNKLGENDNYINHFVMANKSLTDVSITNFKLELNRLYVKRSECIENFIAKSRKEIEQLWDMLHYSDSDRRRFTYYDFDVSSTSLDKEFVLNNHDKEISQLKQEYKEKEPILALFEQLRGLLKDQQFLKESSRDSSRLLSKNSCKILLNEEKIRKKINKSMPRLIDSIKSKISEYNLGHSTDSQSRIKVDGADLLECVNSMEDEFLISNGKKGRNKPSPVKPSIGQNVNASPSITPTVSSNASRMHKVKQRPVARRSPLRNYNKQQGNNKISKVVKYPLQKQQSNHTLPKHGNVLNPSSRVDSFTSSLDSPERTESSAPRKNGLQLQPLNSPLKPNSFLSFGSFSDNNSSDGARYLQNSSVTNVSPVVSKKATEKGNFSAASAIHLFSPVHINLSSYSDDKENHNFELSPVKLSGNFDIAGERPSTGESSNRLSVLTGDSSTIMGDDYQQWRNERIKQFSDLS